MFLLFFNFLISEGRKNCKAFNDISVFSRFNTLCAFAFSSCSKGLIVFSNTCPAGNNSSGFRRFCNCSSKWTNNLLFANSFFLIGNSSVGFWTIALTYIFAISTLRSSVIIAVIAISAIATVSIYGSTVEAALFCAGFYVTGDNLSGISSFSNTLGERTRLACNGNATLRSKYGRNEHTTLLVEVRCREAYHRLLRLCALGCLSCLTDCIGCSTCKRLCLRIANYNYLTCVSSTGSKNAYGSELIDNCNTIFFRTCSTCFLTELNYLFSSNILGNNGSIKLCNIVGIGEGTFNHSCAILNERRKLGLSIFSKIFRISIVSARKGLTYSLFNLASERVVSLDFLINFGRNLLCLCGIACSYSVTICFAKSSNNLTLVVKSIYEMLCLLIILGSISTTELILIIALMLLEQAFAFSELLAHFASALTKLTLADLILLALLATRCAGCATNNAIIVIIKLADIGKRRFLIFTLIILVHILFEDLRKLLYFSACENVVCKSCRRSCNLIKRISFKLLRISIILVNSALKVSLTTVGILAESLCCRKTFRVKFKNASLIFSAFCKAIKLFFLGLRKLVFSVSLCKLLAKAIYNFIIITDLLFETARAKTRKTCKHTKACNLTDRHTENSVFGITVIISNVCVVTCSVVYDTVTIGIALNCIVDDKLRVRNFFNNSIISAKVKHLGCATVFSNATVTFSTNGEESHRISFREFLCYCIFRYFSLFSLCDRVACKLGRRGGLVFDKLINILYLNGSGSRKHNAVCIGLLFSLGDFS